jgi:RNA polymerase sigma-70 factor (ECF subfamily)
MSSGSDHLFDGNRDLLDRYRRGDREALESVYWAYVDPVERLVTRCIRAHGPISPEYAMSVEDLVQDVFTRAFTESSRLAYDGIRDYGPYIFTITRNVVVDAFRRRGREVPTDLGTLNERAASEATEWGQEPPLSTDLNILARVRGYLARLPPDLAAVHRQRYGLGVSQDAAAQALGISRQRLRTLEKKLRDGVTRELRAERAQETSTNFVSSPVLRRG